VTASDVDRGDQVVERDSSGDGTGSPRAGGGEVDVIVLGLGPGGRSAASALATAGLEVVGIDERLVGGECPFYGCTPTKMMVRAAELLAESRRAPGLAGAGTLTPGWDDVAKRIAGEATHEWTDKAEVDELTDSGVRFVRGHGRLTGARTVSAAGTTFAARRGVILGTGTRPSVPPIDGLVRTPYWTNRDAVRVAALPESLIVIGGGSIGVELCQVFARFGVEVSLLEVEDRIMSAAEPEASALVAQALADEGVDVVTGQKIERVDHVGGAFRVELEAGTLEAERLLVASGRTSNLDDIGLETLGLDADATFLECDDQMRVLDGLWAIGDITGKGAYTHVAHYQAEIATAALLHGDAAPRADYRAVPNVTFTDPEVGSVGMTEAQAREGGRRVRVGLADMAQSPRGWVHGPGNSGFVKVVESAEEHVLVGATVAGPKGGELLGQLTLAVHARVPTASLDSMIYAFPTFYETVKQAIDDLH
jgi:pyruvate/2-oxoglutarate dehydrogenase complex dihydrolipoamide dehydrogenase (E3) component